MFNLSKEEITFEVVENFCSEWQEGVRVKYKQEIKDIPKILSSFANTQGGVFMIGVEANQTDNKVQFPIEGIPKTDGIEESIVQSALMGIYPPVIPEVRLVDVPETDNVVVVVRVDESVRAPHAIQNSTRVYIRAESVTQPYKKPELAEMNLIEYLLNRRKDTQGVTQQILDRIEDRTKQFCDMDAPSLTVIARPVFLYRPVISPTAIYDLYKAWMRIKRVTGGVSCLLEPSSNHNLEINEHGIVYYRCGLYGNEEYDIMVVDLINEIASLLEDAKRVYKACDALITVEVTAHLQNVFEKKLPKDFGTGRSIRLNHEPVCYDSEVFTSTSRTYLSRDFEDREQQKSIAKELTMQLLWSFNIPTDNEHIIGYIEKLIDGHIRK